MSSPARWTVRAFGCLAVVATTETRELPFARRTLVGALRALDLACSRFRDDSELVALNRAAGRPVRVSEVLYGALAAAVTTARLSGGLVDPTVGRALRLAGYTVSFERLGGRRALTVPPPPAPTGRLAELELDPERLLVCVPTGVELDLGASAKAWAADQVARAVAAQAGGALVAIGGDVAVCGPAPAGGWPLRIAADHAAAPAAPGPVVAITAGGLASSSTGLRRWQTTSGEQHHIIDPRIGRPARTPWAMASVAAASCLEANAAATAALILGAEAQGWLGRHALPSRLVADDGRVVYIGDWPADAP